MAQEFKITKKIGFIGGGNIAKAICAGMVRKGLITYSNVYVAALHETTLETWKKLGANVTTVNGSIVDEADIIFLSVKPHILPEAIAQMLQTYNPTKAANKLFISVIAGVKLESLENILGDVEGARVIRVMPNTPLLVGEGCSVYCPGQYASESDTELVKKIFEVSGICELVPESLINGIYLVIEALSDGGVKLGIPRKTATTFAAQTVLGAAKMVLETGQHTGVLKEEVTSPGGTTIAGIHALEKGGLRSALMDALEASAKRSAELGMKK
ncbi:hypothetical protein FQA39_LY04842 [Lamprigera yunnana]|nr:hypothetical protein FQA39_LY04842 [Lamprigera yunnana]